MKSIVCINQEIPTLESLDYFSSHSLRDFDIAVFNPKFPYVERVHFSAGGSCISIDGTTRLSKAITHWHSELLGALRSGKTIFVNMEEYKEDQAAVSSEMKSKGQRNYNTTRLDNYQALPVKLGLQNSKGKKINIHDFGYATLFKAMQDLCEYRVIISPRAGVDKILAARDGSAVGAVVRIDQLAGSLVLLPYFDFYDDEFTEEDESGDEEVWTDQAVGVAKGLIAQFVAIDKYLKTAEEGSPPPEWVLITPMPSMIVSLEQEINEIGKKISKLEEQRAEAEKRRSDEMEYTFLLYENGKRLERAIEKALVLMGFSVSTFREGDLEIDHVIVSPSGRRMIGESEGKDNSPIDISKFRQLESNIGEDFERDGIEEHAKGLLFGNGFRLTSPDHRPEQFTKKSLTNAGRLGSALIRTSDLYMAAMQILDDPNNEGFKAACREAIEGTNGDIVKFPGRKS